MPSLRDHRRAGVALKRARAWAVRRARGRSRVSSRVDAMRCLWCAEPKVRPGDLDRVCSWQCQAALDRFNGYYEAEDAAEQEAAS